MGLPSEHIGCIPGQFRIISVPNLRPFWYYSLNEPPFWVRSGEVALNLPSVYVMRVLIQDHVVYVLRETPICVCFTLNPEP